MDSEADQVSFQTGALSLPSDMTEIAENYRRQRQTQGQPLQPAADGRLRGDPQPGAQPIIVAGPDGGPAANADQPDTRGAGERVQAPEQARIIDCGCTIQEGEEESTQPADSCRCNPLAKIVVDKNQSKPRSDMYQHVASL